MEDLLKKIEAFVGGPISARPDVAKIKRPDHGQGDVKDPENDMRLKQNQEKEHQEIREKVRDDENSAGKDKTPKNEEHTEEEKFVNPYERERTDHRASLEFPETGENFADKNQLPLDETKLEKLDNNPVKVKTPKLPNYDAQFMEHPLMQQLRSHPNPEISAYVNRALGPVPNLNPNALPLVRKKVQNLINMAQSDMERNELQKCASLVAELILLNIK